MYLKQQSSEKPKGIIMNIKFIKSAHEIKLPAGEYIMCDPCYIISRLNDWNMFYNAIEQGSNKPVLLEINGKSAIACYTAHGDGCYELFNTTREPDKDNPIYLGVDAGLLAIIPKDVIPTNKPLPLNLIHIFKLPDIVIKIDHKCDWKFGDYELKTSWSVDYTERMVKP
jgi:hypothetical protein